MAARRRAHMLIAGRGAHGGAGGGMLTSATASITHKPTGRKLRYGEVAADAAKLPLPTKVSR